jgi:hypothetical protein
MENQRELTPEELKKEAELKNAIEVLSSHLAEDPGYYIGWQSNIAMTIYDTYKELNPDQASLPVLHAANQGAAKFLDMLISKTRK